MACGSGSVTKHRWLEEIEFLKRQSVALLLHRIRGLNKSIYSSTGDANKTTPE